jgi:hypothetical protein
MAQRNICQSMIDSPISNFSNLRNKKTSPCPIEAGLSPASPHYLSVLHQMFSDQFLLSLLADRIRKIPDQGWELLPLHHTRVQQYSSFKGEGTGAVRHMFSHHILKPERTPLEANVWGTPKSSGAFSTLFESRLIRALDYCENPFEISPASNNGKTVGEKVYGLSSLLGTDIVETFDKFQEGKDLYLSCGDSAKTTFNRERGCSCYRSPFF